ncbi:MAG: short-chain fatty acid transporter [Eubacterium sp.]|nr:short-chain fatty acid transporter [Eubacterium sp.]
MKALSNFFVRLMNRFLPDPFIFCTVLTIVVFIFAIPAAGANPLQLVDAWGGGVWALLAFSMQMALVVVTGTAFATAPPIKRFLQKLAASAKSPAQGVMLVAVIAAIATFVNWGFGLVVGALLGREVAKQVKGVDYRLVIATGYSMFVIWHAGISGSIPLSLNTEANLVDGAMTNTGGAVTALIPTTETIFAPWNLITIVVVVIALTILLGKMHPAPEDTFAVDPALLEDKEREYPKPTTPAEKIENSPVLSMIIGIAGLVYLIHYFAQKGLNGLDLNTVNFIFLILGILLHKTPIRYVHAVGDAASGAAGVMLQFPFYAGIQALMVFSGGSTGTSLAAVISNFFVSISNHVTFPIFTFLAAGIVNFFVPSGGGQWTVQGPIMMPAGLELGVKPAMTAMGIAWGDAWTNLVQPFWALPALGVAGLTARDIMGYCAVSLIISGIIVCIAFIIVGVSGLSAV